MNNDDRRMTLKDIVDPGHLVQAVENSFQHSDETAHGVTGLGFKDYLILVRKRKDFGWYIECNFKRGKRETTSRQRCRRNLQPKSHEDNKTAVSRKDI